MTILEKIVSYINASSINADDVSLRRLMRHECPNHLFDNTTIGCVDDPSYSCDKCWLQTFNEKIHCKVGKFDGIINLYLKNDDDKEIERIESLCKQSEVNKDE